MSGCRGLSTHDPPLRHLAHTLRFNVSSGYRYPFEWSTWPIFSLAGDRRIGFVVHSLVDHSSRNIYIFSRVLLRCPFDFMGTRLGPDRPLHRCSSSGWRPPCPSPFLRLPDSNPPLKFFLVRAGGASPPWIENSQTPHIPTLPPAVGSSSPALIEEGKPIPVPPLFPSLFL